MYKNLRFVQGIKLHNFANTHTINMYQERTFLLLSDHNEEENFKKEVLQSPLGLAKNIIDDLFASKFSDLQAKLDTEVV